MTNTVALFDPFNRLVDCEGNHYSIIRMRGSGFCGFHAMAFSLTGDDMSYNDVIEDCVNVFANIPDLFRLRTSFGGLRESTVSLGEYASFMRLSARQVQAGITIDEGAWCEDGHIAAIALLYDIAIFVYCTQSKQWSVFNELGRRGYVCLMSTPGHFNVLGGIDGPPTVPPAAHTHGVRRQMFNASHELFQHMQRDYRFTHVYQFPEGFTGVRILNNPVVHLAPQTSVAVDLAVAPHDEAVYSCDVTDCRYVSDNRKSLAMHNMRCHKVKRVPLNSPVVHLEPQTTSVAVDLEVSLRDEALYSCNFSQCNYVGHNRKSLAMHNMRCHNVKRVPVTRLKAVVDEDIKSVTSLESTSSQRTQRLARKPSETGAESSLAMREVRCRNVKRAPATKPRAVVDDDISSMTSLESTSSRRSQRLAKKRSVGGTESSLESPTLKRGRHVCEVCGSVHETARGLSIHKASQRCKKTESDVVVRKVTQSKTKSTQKTSRKSRRKETVETDDVMNDDDNVIRTRSLPSTMKHHLKGTFADKISEAEKEFMPKNETKHQTDPLYEKLKKYHDYLLSSVTNTTTEKLSAEVLDVIIDPTVVDDVDRKYVWSKADEMRLNELNKTCKLLQPRPEWTWAAPDDSERGIYNDKRLQLSVTKECEWKIIECENCHSTGILVGDQTDSSVCHDCVKLKRVNEKERQQKQDAWDKVRPKSKEYPKTADNEDLPKLNAGDKAVLSPVLPIVTVVKRSFSADQMRLRMESISLVQDPTPTWSKLLPRTSLADRFQIIERRVRDSTKYIVANPDSVRQWLRYLFLHHKEFIRLRRENKLAIDEAALEALGPNVELAEVDSGLAEHTPSEARQIEDEIERNDEGLNDLTMTAGFSENHLFSFDRFPQLYLKSKDVIRIRKEGKLEIIKDDTIRRPTYSSSANLAFPYLYVDGQDSPLDFQDYKLGRYLLKKQALYAHRMKDGRLQWNFAEDDIHMAHQYSRLSEQTVRATVGYYISSHPSVAHVPLGSILTAFRDGVDQDSGLLDSHLPDLTTVMSQLPNCRQRWFSERLGIEAISRDLGSPNVFVTINLDPRASPDVRRLIHKLEFGTDMQRDEPFVKNTAEFTRLMNKYAPQIAIYLYRKVKIMMNVFFTKICGIPDKEPKGDWRQQDTTETSWFWGRVEFTETRGVPHFHYLAKLPNVLETDILGRIIHNGRVVRQELKCGNIKPEKRHKAFEMIEASNLASRYAAMFSQSISTASFYTEDVGIDDHDDSKVIKLEDYRKEYAKNYKEGNINLKTHPIMRRFDDAECEDNLCLEMARVASVSSLHQCLRGSCGGDPMNGEGCRFDFPKKKLNHTVAAVMQVNATQMEARILLRRTCDRVANLNRYLIRYLRSNHDVSVLIDSAHKLRYATKYCAKSGKHTQLLDEMIEHLNKRSTDLLPPNMKQTLTHLLLADCSHRAFISKQELSYRVMQLPDVVKSFANVDVVGFYKRANLQVPCDDDNTIEYSDRTEYSAYAERCRENTELGRGLTKDAVENMCLNEFAETVQHKWIISKKGESNVVDETTKRKFRTRDVSTGHWRLTLCNKRKHIRPSTVLHTAPAIDFEFVQHGTTTTQTTFYDLSIDKRHQLYRSYYELVTYRPWKNTPDETFLSDNVRAILEDKNRHGEIDSRHSLQRLEEFFKVYQRLYDDGEVAPPGSPWQRDNRFSYSMFLVNQHNREIKLDRVDNRGVLKAQFEDVDELVDVDVDIRPSIDDVADLSEYPTFENFMPPDMFRDIVEQKPQDMAEICVAFPLQHQWQQLEEIVTHNKVKRFIANPPPSPVDYDDMTPIQKFAVDMGKDVNQQILFVCGKAGSGKTAVALKICEFFYSRLQCTSYTGKASALFNGPTIHSLFAWSHNEHRSTSTEFKPDSKKVQDFRVAHEGIELFVIEEAMAIPPAHLALMDEMMSCVFNPRHVKNSQRVLPPFGGMKMLFLGDQAQLPPIGGPAVYDDGRLAADSDKTRRESKQSKRTKAGQLIFEKYLVPNCIYLQRGQRNSGLLGEICDRMRKGELTDHDCTMLTYQKEKFPDVCADVGIHYQNEMCSMYNWRQLWNECRMSQPQRRMFICKATYHVTGSNENIVDALSVLPPQAYDYAPDILCVAEGCEVRLLQNVNVAAGLATSITGTVVKVIYNDADVSSVIAGQHAVPYCIVVSFAGFQGFVEQSSCTDRRTFPFPNQRTWVPIFRKRFNVKISSLPAWIRKKQLEKDCFRIQFPIDLASNITAHRAQGQTMADCLVSVDFGLEHPDVKLPAEIASLLYVACTRVTKLENLFLSPIHPSVWRKIGQNEADVHRRAVDEKLQKASAEFASEHGMYQEMLDELSWTADTSKNADEWRSLQEQTAPPKSNGLHARRAQQFSDTDFDVDIGEYQFSMFCRPVLSERHIGIDQGIQTFGIAVVERTVGQQPNVVEVKNYTNLGLKDGFKASDALIALSEKTDLLFWMEPDNGDNKVDRVIVHLEQIDVRNRNSKQLTVKLGKLLQQQVTDSKKCIVKMSQPHIHRARGPAFQLGQEIIDALQLKPALYLQRRSKAESNPSVAVAETEDIESELSDVEPSDETATDRTRKSQNCEYRAKKKMSSDVFRYIIDADESQLRDMKLTVEKRVQDYWRELLDLNVKVKLDDAGDALLHALDELLCGSTNFKQLVPSAPAVHVNRTVAVAVFPDTTYWIVLNCRWNTFVFENFGWFCSGLSDCYYKSPTTVETIENNFRRCKEVWSSLSEFESSTLYDAVDHIKVVVKQLTGHTELRLKNEEAGALTDATTKAMKRICDGVIGINSRLFDRRDRILGSMYSRTSKVHSDRKFQIINSTGKHTNAVLSCLSWMKENLRDFVDKRREILSEQEKQTFFNAILNVARSAGSSMEMLQVSETVKVQLRSDAVASVMKYDKTFTRNVADLVLVAISKNAQHVKAVAANSRKPRRATKPQFTAEQEDDVER